MQRIPDEKVIERIRAENPWWGDSGRIGRQFASLSPREYFSLFYPLVAQSEVRRAVVLMGPRRVGKTVILHQTVQKLIDNGVPPETICYISVDNPLYNGRSLDDLIGFCSRACGHDLREQKCFLFFDEIQYLRDWETHLKIVVDSYPSMRCVASGSAAAALRLKSRESGAGRFTDFLLPPLTFHEYLLLLGKNDLVEPVRKSDDAPEGTLTRFITPDIDTLNDEFMNYLNFGGYPEVIFSPEIQADPARFIKSDIIDKVLLRDLPSLYGISDVQELNSLFTTLAYNTAGEVSLEGLSQNSGVSKNTLKRYSDYLEAAFLIRIVHRVDRSARRFKRANFFKVYLTNPSIRAALFSPITQDDEAMGSLVETAVFAQWFHFPQFLPHYARWDKGEVDIVNVDQRNRVSWAVEVKWSDYFFNRPEKLQNFCSFCKSHELRTGLVTTKTKAGEATHRNVLIEFVPAALYCYAVGYNIVHIHGPNRIRLTPPQ